MTRMLAVAVVILLAGALVGGALVTRYRYGFAQGVPLFRVDTWTGQVQQWQSCVRSQQVPIPIPSNFFEVIADAERRPGLEQLDLSDIPGDDKRKSLLQWLYGTSSSPRGFVNPWARATPGGTESKANTVETDRKTWEDITNWIRDGQKQESQAGKVVHGTSLWLSLLQDKKNKGEWDLTHQVCEAGWK
jgi:hypothetical protein